MPAIQEKFIATGQVQLVWHHYPLPIHENARSAAIAAECARQQGKFWEFHDWAFENQGALTATNVTLAIGQLGINNAAFDKCRAGPGGVVVDADFREAEGLSIGGTPTWLLGHVQPGGTVTVLKRVDGARPFARFESDIAGVLAAVADLK